MDKKKLQEKINFIKEHNDEIDSACIRFYMRIGMGRLCGTIQDISSIADIIFRQEGYEIIHIPMDSSEIGAMLVKINDSKYLIINTERTIAHNNFAIAHELYHVLIQNSSLNPIDVYKDSYEDDDNELMADAFAGRILMPTSDFNAAFSLFGKSIATFLSSLEKDTNYMHQFFMVLLLMNYFKTTYMSVVIRCFEEMKFDINDNGLVEALLANNSEDLMLELCQTYAQNHCVESIMRKSRADDFEGLCEAAQKKAKELVNNNLMSQEDYEYRLEGLKRAYAFAKGEKFNDETGQH